VTISPMRSPVDFAASRLGGASNCANGAPASAARGGDDPLAAVFALTRDVDALASSGLGDLTGLPGQDGAGTPANLLGGGGAAGSIAGMLA